ncbi:MAG: pyridoxal-phosphate dependent enzyme, partial [bacterium]|nr:pyridoxal-phosphate dependent enzyme [bacterium]
AFDLSMEYSARGEGLSRNTGYNPLTVEGKKTAALEIYKQLSSAPEVVFVPTGDGVILSGIYKGFRDLKALGFIEKVPLIYAVQAGGSDALNRAFKTGNFDARPTATVADSICVDVPRNGFHALENLKRFDGRCITVSDEAILEAQKELSSLTGCFAEPAAAASYAGFVSVRDQIDKDAAVVLMITGNGLKDIESAAKQIKVPQQAVTRLDELI